MSEEEKEAIKIIEETHDMLVNPKLREEKYTTNDFEKAFYVVIMLIRKQQKKIEELEKGNRSLMESRIKWKDRYYKEKSKNKTLEELLQGNLFELYLYYKELASKYQANSISKDEVREKIKELSKAQDFKVGLENYTIKILKELIGEK